MFVDGSFCDEVCVVMDVHTVIMYLATAYMCRNNKSGDGLVGYDDWFTPSRSGVRFSVPVHFDKLFFSFLPPTQPILCSPPWIALSHSERRRPSPFNDDSSVLSSAHNQSTSSRSESFNTIKKRFRVLLLASHSTWRHWHSSTCHQLLLITCTLCSKEPANMSTCELRVVLSVFSFSCNQSALCNYYCPNHQLLVLLTNTLLLDSSFVALCNNWNITSTLSLDDSTTLNTAFEMIGFYKIIIEHFISMTGVLDFASSSCTTLFDKWLVTYVNMFFFSFNIFMIKLLYKPIDIIKLCACRLKLIKENEIVSSLGFKGRITTGLEGCVPYTLMVNIKYWCEIIFTNTKVEDKINQVHQYC